MPYHSIFSVAVPINSFVYSAISRMQLSNIHQDTIFFHFICNSYSFTKATLLPLDDAYDHLK